MSMPLSAAGPVPVIRPRKNERMSPFVEVMADKEAADLEEHWRLLYVALTRASERLVIAGIEPTTALAENSWHKRVEPRCSQLGQSGMRIRVGRSLALSRRRHCSSAEGQAAAAGADRAAGAGVGEARRSAPKAARRGRWRPPPWPKTANPHLHRAPSNAPRLSAGS